MSSRPRLSPQSVPPGRAPGRPAGMPAECSAHRPQLRGTPCLIFRQGESKLGAPLRKIVSPDGAAVVLDQPFANRKPQTQAGFFAADKRLKETLANARANARPIIANTYFDPMILGRPAISNRFHGAIAFVLVQMQLHVDRPSVW